MLCALTVRALKPGSFDAFREAFMASADISDPPEGGLQAAIAPHVDSVGTDGIFEVVEGVTR